MKKLKTFESYENLGNNNNPNKQGNNNTPSREQINAMIKEIILNVIKTKKYVKMLRDTTDHVHELVLKQYPDKCKGFIDEVDKRDSMLSELLDLIYVTFINSEALEELEEVIGNIEQIEQYTKNNLDGILNQDNDVIEEDDLSDISDEDLLNYKESEGNPNSFVEEDEENQEDQLRRRNPNPTNNPFDEDFKKKQNLSDNPFDDNFRGRKK